MDSFSNQTINFQELPDYKKTTLTPIAKRYKKIVIFNLILSNVILLGLAISVYFFLLDEVETIYKLGGLFILFLILILFDFFTLMAFKRKSFAFREQDVIYCSGILTITHEIVPYNRLQHVVLKQGWFSRYLGLATIECFTAASANNEIAIPGLELKQAEQIKNMLLNKIIKNDLNEPTFETVSLEETTHLENDFSHQKKEIDGTN